jgi:hypothetical protein
MAKFQHTLTCVCGFTVIMECEKDGTVEIRCPNCGRKIFGYAIGNRMGTVVITYRVGG